MVSLKLGWCWVVPTESGSFGLRMPAVKGFNYAALDLTWEDARKTGARGEDETTFDNQ